MSCYIRTEAHCLPVALNSPPALKRLPFHSPFKFFLLILMRFRSDPNQWLTSLPVMEIMLMGPEHFFFLVIGFWWTVVQQHDAEDEKEVRTSWPKLFTFPPVGYNEWNMKDERDDCMINTSLVVRTFTQRATLWSNEIYECWQRNEIYFSYKKNNHRIYNHHRREIIIERFNFCNTTACNLST